MGELAAALLEYRQVAEVYAFHQKWTWKSSSIVKAQEAVQLREKEIRQCIVDVDSIVIAPSAALSVSGMKMALEKSELVTKLIALVTSFTPVLNDVTKCHWSRTLQTYWAAGVGGWMKLLWHYNEIHPEQCMHVICMVRK